MNQANRILALEPEEVTNYALMTLEESDIEIPIIKVTPQNRKIGFGA